MNRWYLGIFIIVLFFTLLGVVFFNRELISLHNYSQTNFLASTQRLAEMNYRLSRELLGAKNNIGKLETTLNIHKRITNEQKDVIDLQKQVSMTQTSKIDGLIGELGGAKIEIDKLKKTGGEPLPKDFINSLLKATVRIRCSVARVTNGESIIAGSGSVLGRYDAVGGEYVVMTNAHVLKTKEGTNDYDCDVIFGPGYRYDASVVTKVSGSGYDFAFLKLGEFINEPTDIVSYSELGVGFCESSDIEIDDLVTVLSYPGFTGPERAVSEGRITNIFEGPIYEASALIDLGSSGGVAISNKKRCLIGMPTWKGVGEKLGLGYIQSWSMMLSLDQ